MLITVTTIRRKSSERSPSSSPGRHGWPQGPALPYLFQLGRALVAGLLQQVPGAAAVSPPVRGADAFRPVGPRCGVTARRGRLAAHVPGTCAGGNTHTHGVTVSCRRALENHRGTQQKDARPIARSWGLREEKGVAPRRSLHAPPRDPQPSLRALPGLLRRHRAASTARRILQRDRHLEPFQGTGDSGPRGSGRADLADSSGGAGALARGAAGLSHTVPRRCPRGIEYLAMEERQAPSSGCGHPDAFPPCPENPTKGVGFKSAALTADLPLRKGAA